MPNIIRTGREAEAAARTGAAPTINELRARVTEKGPWFVVPAGTVPSLCKGCDAMVYYITTAASKPMPIDVLVPGGVFPRREFVSNGVHTPRDGRGVSHFATCPKSAAFRRPAGSERP